MPKSSSSYQHQTFRSQPLHRRAIHERDEEIEAEEEDDDDEVDYLHLGDNKLYPDLKEELYTLQSQKGLRKKEKKRNEQKQKKSAKSGKPAYGGTSNSSEFMKYIIFCSSALLLFLASVIGLGYKFDFFNYGSQRKTGRDVTELIKDMQNLFKDQQSETFQLLKLALSKVVDEKSNPSAPAIITIIANRGAENTASDFSIYLAKALAPEEYVSINESAHWQSDPDGLKYKIDNDIRSKLGNGNLNVVIVDSLHNIPVDAAIIFHAYCDHESAPYKRAVFLFIVHLEGSIPRNSDSKYRDTVAMNNLRDIWRSASDDLVDSLITRITVTVVNIR